MCKTTKEVWHTLIITHQGNSQVNYCKIDLLTQEYKKFSIFNDKTIDSDFTQFNAIITSLKSLDLDYFSKKPQCTIEEAKDLATLPLDELIGNLKVYEAILGINGVASKPIKEKVMPIALKANFTGALTSNDSVKKHDKFDICKEKTKGGESSGRERGCYNCGNKNHFIGDCLKSKRNKAFV
ncbi:UBN2 domain-containing protein [Tanacetum coccineum]